jgi:hypothetical protein
VIGPDAGNIVAGSVHVQNACAEALAIGMCIQQSMLLDIRLQIGTVHLPHVTERDKLGH